ncbi:hypothetical protein FISHEDRAFT_77684 [Fistulina hepatica ATCC 64428]|uniref:Uncharacterized protein n=1 Tax=Fistulina hepatica ATCC 64428 TaxID=1128425 RepID=A0A0D7A0Q2_9AGAR|nr:hypothetical protein FISHEDRAFT_77684 [Fistulina hepatica ATCC 64428]
MSVPSTSSNTVYYYAMIGGDYAGVYMEMIHSTPAKDKSLIPVPIIIKLYTVEDVSHISNHLNKVLKHLDGASCTVTDFMNFLIDCHHIIKLDQILKDEEVLTSNKHQFYTVFESSNAVSCMIYHNWHTDIKPWSMIPGKYNTRYHKFLTLCLAIAAMVLHGDEALLNAYGVMEAADRTVIYNNLHPASKVYDIQMDSKDKDKSTGIYAESYNYGQLPAKSGHHPPSHLSFPQKREHVQVSILCPTSQVVYNCPPPSLAWLSAPNAHVTLPPGALQVSSSSSLGGSPSLLSFELSMDELTLQTSADDSEEARNELLAGITHNDILEPQATTYQFNYPTVYTTSNKGKDFMEFTYNKSLTLFAKQFKAYLLSGINDMIKSVQAVTMDKKKQIVVMILMKLREAPYSIVVEYWPLARFCGSHDINDKVQLNILYRALETSMTSFCHLMPSEKIEWEQGLIHSVTHANAGTAAPMTNDAAAMPMATPQAASSIPQAAHMHIPPSSTPSGVQPLPSQPQVFISPLDELASLMSFTSASTLTITTSGGMTTGTSSFQFYLMAGYLPPPAGQLGYPAAYFPPPAGQPYPVAAYLPPPANQSAAAAPLSTLFINMNTNNVLKRKQKEHTDKGMPHGPHKKCNADTGSGWPTPAL